jgi:hypothetical protein
VSDVEVSPDGKLLMLGAEGGFGSGVYWYDLTDPVKPAFQAQSAWGDVHAATFAAIGGRLYTFAVRDPLGPALVIYNVTRLLPP